MGSFDGLFVILQKPYSNSKTKIIILLLKCFKIKDSWNQLNLVMANAFSCLLWSDFIGPITALQ